MQCPSCNFENPAGMKFCGQCGAQLSNRCSQCGFDNPSGFQFCGECGSPLAARQKAKRGKSERARKQSSVQRLESRVQKSSESGVRSPESRPISYTPKHLAERILAEREALEARGAPDGERKTITALFADLKGSTALIEDLDPEDARRIIDPALQIMMDAVHRYEGYVTQSLGDGIFALFGAPIAHEDHAHRALYAALRMQEEMRRYAEQRRREGGVPMYLRVGVNTGEVVVRSIRKDDLHTDYVPVGHSTNIASRMESLATPGSIVVSAHTHRLTEGYFEFKALGATQVKGITEPLHIYEVLGVGPLRTKLQVAARRGLVRFVGRQSEMEQIQRALESAKAGHGQIVGVMGEPGVGKSRLFHEFKLTAQRGCLVLETFSVSHGKAYPYLPLIDLLKNYFQLTVQDDERRRREKITGRVLTLDRNLEDVVPYLFFLLGIAEPTSPLQQIDLQIRRRRILEAIKRLLVRESLDQPLILIFEDLHWLDAETQEFLLLLSEGVATARILLLVNYRPEYHHSWGGKTYYTQLRLDPLGQEQAQELLAALLGDGADLQPLKRLILEKTEGNPFFMEEIVQDLFEQGVLIRDPRRVGTAHLDVGATDRSPLPTDLHIPTTVQGVLAARIDRLPPEEKAVLQTLAVIGKEFSLSLLKKVVEQPEEELYRLLSHLQAGEFIYEQPAFPDVEYTFKHALTQEVAHNSVLLERRKVLHEHTAQAIEEIYHVRLEEYYGELAHHYRRSGNTIKAIEYLGLAGQQAVQRSANAEAINHLTAALALLNTLPDTPERSQRELTLQIALGNALMATKGYTAPEVEQAYTRARALCQQIGETPQLFPVLWGLWAVYVSRAELQTGRELAEQFLRLAQDAQDSALLVEAYSMLGGTLFLTGELASAQAHTEQGMALYDAAKHGSLAVLYGEDPGVLCLCYGASAQGYLGYPDRALKRIEEALTLAQELAHPHSLANALYWAAMLQQFRREGPGVQGRAEALLALCTEQGFPHWLAAGNILQGWALAVQGQGEEGIAQLRQGRAALRALGQELTQSYILALLAEAYGKTGQMDKGLAALGEAIDFVDRTGERFYEAELYRLKGQLTLQQFQVSGFKFQVPNPQVEAEECFLKAIDVAQRQSAKSLELRAAMSLSRLWQQQGKNAEARQMLAEIYGWFTEGFDTADLKDAKELLEELSQ
jgi:predicted ATPase/class 3 adenylate cyclase